MYKKLVIIINGSGEKGKDTLIDFFSEKYLAMNVSSIDPYKSVAYDLGWDGKKDEKGRKFLSDLKKVSIEYNDYPLTHVVKEYRRFAISNFMVLFIHAREAAEIEKYKEEILKIHDVRVVTLLVDRQTTQGKLFGNRSDDNVHEFEYDYTYMNDFPLDVAGDKFIEFMETFILDMSVINTIVTPEDIHMDPTKIRKPIRKI